MRPALTFWLLAVAFFGTLVGSLFVGHASLADASLRGALLELRGLRSAATVLAGAALAVAGVLVQGLFRNPLASPSVLGTTAGAALGGQCALYAHAALIAVLPTWLASEMALPLGCLAGAGLALVAVLAIAGRGDDVLGLLLTGFVLSALLAGVGAVVTVLALDSWQLGRAMLAFSLGGVSGIGAKQVLLALPLVVIALLAAWSWAGDLDLLLCGEDEAASLGVEV
uniref:iron chelate uptake ABC transporter family permease subunit n=1 Tax=uncultured Arthrobacter sp. TaxID=114050 RepID=UPI00321808C4